MRAAVLAGLGPPARQRVLRTGLQQAEVAAEVIAAACRDVARATRQLRRHPPALPHDTVARGRDLALALSLVDGLRAPELARLTALSTALIDTRGDLTLALRVA